MNTKHYTPMDNYMEYYIQLPEKSLLKRSKWSFDYLDKFQGEIITNGYKFDIKHILKIFVSSGPKWADTLMAIRDKIVGVFGVRTSDQLTDEQKRADNYKYEVGEQIGIFKIFDKSENEFILGENDKHLNFRVSILIEHTDLSKINLVVMTGVEFNNIWGRLYFLPVKPFHKLIVKATLKEIIKKIENEAAGKN